MPKSIEHYADIAVELALYHEKAQRTLMEEEKAEEIKLERFVYETEVGELEKVFLADYKDYPGIQGSFHDFITEIQITPGNYKKSYKELMDRIPLLIFSLINDFADAAAAAGAAEVGHSAENSAETGHDFGGRERLYHMVVRAGIETCDPFDFF